MPAVTGRSPTGQRVGCANGGGDWPFDHPDGPGQAKPGQKPKALIRNVTENRQVYARRLRVVPGWPAVVASRLPRVPGWPAVVASLLAGVTLPPPASSCRTGRLAAIARSWLIVHPGILAPGPMAAHHTSRVKSAGPRVTVPSIKQGTGPKTRAARPSGQWAIAPRPPPHPRSGSPRWCDARSRVAAQHARMVARTAEPGMTGPQAPRCCRAPCHAGGRTHHPACR